MTDKKKKYNRHQIYSQLEAYTSKETLQILKDYLAGTRTKDEMIEAMLALTAMYVGYFSSYYKLSDKNFIDEWVSEICLQVVKYANNNTALERTANHPNASMSYQARLRTWTALVNMFRMCAKYRRYHTFPYIRTSETSDSTAEVDLLDYVDKFVWEDKDGDVFLMRMEGKSSKEIRKALRISPKEYKTRVDGLINRFLEETRSK